MSVSEPRLTGGCLCAAVRYAVHAEPKPVIACHCTQCRRMTGHFMAAAFVPEDSLELLEQHGLRWYRSSDHARRGFCSECGSTLFWKGDADDEIGVAAGSVDSPNTLRFAGHVYVGDKGDYYELTDGLPQYATDAEVP